MQLSLNEVIQISINVESSIPYYSKIRGVFTCGNESITIPCFYKEKNQWALHFSPYTTGLWNYKIMDENENILKEGSLECISSKDNKISPLKTKFIHNRYLFTSDNKPHLIRSYECDWLFALWMEDREGAIKLIDKIIDMKFDSIIMNFYAHECVWTDPSTPNRLVPPPLYIWGGSNENPNFSVLNEAFYSKLDELFLYLQEKNLYTFVYFFVYNKNTNYPLQGSREEQMYLEQTTARYQGFSNIIWIYAKELYLNPDKENITKGIKLIKSTDAYNRLFAIHDDKIFMLNPENRKLIDFEMLQQHNDFYEYTKNLAWTGDMPVLHSEFGYEAGISLEDITYGEAQRVEEFVLRAWDVAMAGASLTYYYTYTSWDVIRPNDNPPGYNMFKTLNSFFLNFDWWNYEPRPELLMWTPSRCLKHKEKEEYIFITNNHGRLLIDYPIDKTDFKGEWLHPFTGEYIELNESHLVISECNSQATILTSPYEKQNNNLDFSILKLQVSKK